MISSIMITFQRSGSQGQEDILWFKTGRRLLKRFISQGAMKQLQIASFLKEMLFLRKGLPLGSSLAKV